MGAVKKLDKTQAFQPFIGMKLVCLICGSDNIYIPNIKDITCLGCGNTGMCLLTEGTMSD